MWSLTQVTWGVAWDSAFLTGFKMIGYCWSMDHTLSSKGLKDSTEINFCLSIGAKCEGNVSMGRSFETHFLSNCQRNWTFLWLYLGQLETLLRKLGSRIWYLKFTKMTISFHRMNFTFPRISTNLWLFLEQIYFFYIRKVFGYFCAEIPFIGVSL